MFVAVSCWCIPQSPPLLLILFILPTPPYRSTFLIPLFQNVNLTRRTNASTSADVPAPAHHTFDARVCNFSQRLSATVDPSVARVSAAKINTVEFCASNAVMVVPVERVLSLICGCS